MNDCAVNRHRRLLWPGFVALVVVAVTGVAAASPITPLTLRVSAPAKVHGNDSRDISVTIANAGSEPVLVLPNSARLRIEGVGAEYVPYPGPPIDPWGGAHELAPGAAATVVFRDTSDKRGVWRLPPGIYRITAIYEVRAESPAAAVDRQLEPGMARPRRKPAGDDDGRLFGPGVDATAIIAPTARRTFRSDLCRRLPHDPTPTISAIVRWASHCPSERGLRHRRSCSPFARRNPDPS